MAMSKRAQALASKKIAVLRHEGVPQKQAVAMGLNMAREGRVTPSGGYRHVAKKKG